MHRHIILGVEKLMLVATELCVFMIEMVVILRSLFVYKKSFSQSLFC